MTAHEQLRDELPLYAVGALSGEESERVKRHLAVCHECREDLLGLQEAAAQIAMAVERVAPTARLRGKLLARLEKTWRVNVRNLLRAPRINGRARRFGALGAWFWAPAFAAACLALCLGWALAAKIALSSVNSEGRSSLRRKWKRTNAFWSALRALIETPNGRRCAALHAGGSGSETATGSQSSVFPAATQLAIARRQSESPTCA